MKPLTTEELERAASFQAARDVAPGHVGRVAGATRESCTLLMRVALERCGHESVPVGESRAIALRWFAGHRWEEVETIADGLHARCNRLAIDRARDAREAELASERRQYAIDGLAFQHRNARRR